MHPVLVAVVVGLAVVGAVGGEPHLPLSDAIRKDLPPAGTTAKTHRHPLEDPEHQPAVMDPSAVLKDGGSYRTPLSSSPLLSTAATPFSLHSNSTPFDGIVLQDELRGFNLAFYAIFLPLSLLGNIYCISVVIVIAGHQPVRKSIPDILVGTLSCVELFSMAGCHAISVIAMINSAWIFPPSICAVQSFSVSLYIGLEFLVQAAISLDRYIALTTPFRYQRWGSAATVRLVICAIIGSSVLLAVALKVTSQRESRLLTTWYICTSPFDLHDAVSICVMAVTSLIFGASFIIIIVCNLHLVRTLCQYNSLGVSNAVREITDVVNGGPPEYPMINSPLPPHIPMSPAINRMSICSAIDRKDSTLILTPRKSKSSLIPSAMYLAHRASIVSHHHDNISSDIEGVTYNFTSDSSDKDNLDVLSQENKLNAEAQSDQNGKLNNNPTININGQQECSIMITIEEASGDESSPTRSPVKETPSIPTIELIDEENNVHKSSLEHLSNGIEINHVVNHNFKLPEITIESEPDEPSSYTNSVMSENHSGLGGKPEDVYLTPNHKSNDSSLLTPQSALLPNRLNPAGSSPLRSPVRLSFSGSASLDPSMALGRRASGRSSMVSIYRYPGTHRPSHLSIPGQELEANPLLYMSYLQRQVAKVMRLMEKAANRQKREVVLARVVFINACVFVTTWLPFMATAILSWFRIPVPPLVSDISLKLVFSHALINPVFHGLCRHNYRKGFLFITRMILHYLTLGYVKAPSDEHVFYESRRRKVKRHLQAAAQVRTDRARRRRQSALCVQALSHRLSTHRLSVQPHQQQALAAAAAAAAAMVNLPTPTPSRSRTSSRSLSATPLDFAHTPQLQSMFEQYLEDTESDSQLSSIDYDALDVNVNDHETLIRHLASSYVDLYDADLYMEEGDLGGGDAEVDCDHSIVLTAPPTS